MVENIALCGYVTPTPIQAFTIPAVILGRDIIGVAQTGKSAIHRFKIEADIVQAPARPQLS